MLIEPIRLVIWDLDETFWRGTLAEEGLTEYVRAHHDAVIELCRRGIMNSICSKNDMGQAREVLEREGLWDYFIFPSIDWTSKGPRIARIITQAQLRPATILFVDDNPSNLAEAKAMVPDIQIADPSAIETMLAGPSFVGTADAALTRLAQYKLLERRQTDADAGFGDNVDFLRRSDIRVEIISDIEPHLDRAIELINRTNQLNFTKRRLPTELSAAREQLLQETRPFTAQAGLVRVTDRYGDYGICGFYALRESRYGVEVDYFCFSCRILGMGVENWLYDRLGNPPIRVAGELVTDLDEDRRVDWINQATQTAPDKVSDYIQTPQIMLRGGCELDPIAHYARLLTNNIVQETNVLRLAGIFEAEYLDELVTHAARDFGRSARAAVAYPFHAPLSDHALLGCAKRRRGYP